MKSPAKRAIIRLALTLPQASFRLPVPSRTSAVGTRLSTPILSPVSLPVFRPLYGKPGCSWSAKTVKGAIPLGLVSVAVTQITLGGRYPLGWFWLRRPSSHSPDPEGRICAMAFQTVCVVYTNPAASVKPHFLQGRHSWAYSVGDWSG